MKLSPGYMILGAVVILSLLANILLLEIAIGDRFRTDGWHFGFEQRPNRLWEEVPAQDPPTIRRVIAGSRGELRSI